MRSLTGGPVLPGLIPHHSTTDAQGPARLLLGPVYGHSSALTLVPLPQLQNLLWQDLQVILSYLWLLPRPPEPQATLVKLFLEATIPLTTPNSLWLPPTGYRGDLQVSLSQAPR